MRIGSGAGGAVVAKELAEAGLSVIILEAGEHTTQVLLALTSQRCSVVFSGTVVYGVHATVRSSSHKAEGSAVQRCTTSAMQFAHHKQFYTDGGFQSMVPL